LINNVYIMTEIYLLNESIYLVELTNGKFFISLKYNIKELLDKYEIKEKIKYKTYNADILLLRLKNNYKTIEINNNLFTLKNINGLKQFIEKLIIEIHNKLLKNTCHICKFSTYKNENYVKHLNNKSHNKQIKEENININSNLTITNNNIINNNTITNNNNISIVAFGEENIDNIPHGRMITILDSYYLSVYKLIEYIHANIFRKENYNIYIKKNKGYKYDGTKYIKCDVNELIEELITKKIKDVKKIFKKCKQLNDNDELEDINNKFDDKFIKDCKKLFKNDFNYETILNKSGNAIKLLLEYIESVFRDNISSIKQFTDYQ